MFRKLFRILHARLGDVLQDVLTTQRIIWSNVHDHLGRAVAKVTVTPKIFAFALIHINDIHDGRERGGAQSSGGCQVLPIYLIRGCREDDIIKVTLYSN